MIFGIGIDTASVARVEKSIKRESFMKKVYGEEELAFFSLHKKFAQSAAANFAAKEAFSKALGTGILTGAFNLNEVQVLRNGSGKPYFVFSGEALAIIKQDKLTAHVSLTHEGGFATAFVVLEK